MRRVAVATLVIGAALALDTGPAAAHFCPQPAEIPVGRSDTIQVGVTVEATPVGDVEITLAAGLGVDRVDSKDHWTAARESTTRVRFRGGPIPAYRCEYFSLGVTAAAKGVYSVVVVQRGRDGTVVARSTPDPTKPYGNLGQLVYAGVPLPRPPSSGAGTSLTTILGIALVGIGIVFAGALGVRGWLARGESNEDDENDDALRERVEEFKKQARRRRTPD